jgi:putative ABC transport system permease protein
MANSGRDLVERVAALPGIESAATSNDLPLAGGILRTDLTLHPGPAGADGEQRSVLFHRVSPGYFRTIGTPMLAGRDFVESDASSEAQLTSPRAPRRDGAAIVNETAARLLRPDGHALEQFLSTSFDRSTTPRRRVVGIVADTHRDSPGMTPAPEVYIPFAEDPAFAMTLLVRTPLALDRLVPAIRTTVAEVDPQLSAASAVRLEDIVSNSVARPRLSAQITGAFAAVALLLSAVGVYGVLAYAVACRRREVGIRLALGATARHIGKIFLTSVGRAVAAGLIAGAVLAFVIARALSSLLFGVGPTDPVAFGAGAAILIVAALAASYIPLRRAIAVDPAVTLRE